MENITELSGNNLGSVVGLWLLKASAVLSIPQPNTNYITSEILMTDETQKSGISFIPESCGFSETGEDTKNGFLWNKKIALSIARISPEINQWISENIHEGFIAILKDGNQTINIIGDTDFPLRIKKITADRKQKISARNEYDFLLEASHKYQSYFYMMFEPLPDGSRKIFENAFDFEFE